MANEKIHNRIIPETIVTKIFLLLRATRKAIVPASILGKEMAIPAEPFEYTSEGTTSAARAAGGIYLSIFSKKGVTFRRGIKHRKRPLTTREEIAIVAKSR